MPNSEYKSKQEGRFTAETGLTLTAPPERITVDKYHIMYIIQGLLQRPKGRKWQDVAIPAALFIGVFLALLTTTSFRDFLSIEADVWKAIVVIIAVVSFIWMVVQGVNLGRYLRKNPQKTPEQIYEGITTKMAEDWKRFTSITPPQDIDKEGSQT